MGASGFTRVLVAALVAMAGFTLVAPTAVACGDVDVQTEDDACARVLAVSAFGDASGDGACNDAAGCVAVSGTGNAQNDVHDEGCGGRESVTIATCVAVSGTGDARNRGGEFSCGASATPTLACLAVSGTGDAENSRWHDDAADGGRCGFPTYAVNAIAVACWSVSGTGNASFAGGAHSCEAIASCIAVSGTGDARGESHRCYGALGATCGTCVTPERVEPTYCGEW